MLPMLLSVSACGISGLGTSDRAVLTDLSCAGWRQISLSRQDKLTEKTESEILGHNEFGERRGCWKSPR